MHEHIVSGAYMKHAVVTKLLLRIRRKVDAEREF
jgi:hypothetical protein